MSQYKEQNRHVTKLIFECFLNAFSIGCSGSKHIIHKSYPWQMYFNFNRGVILNYTILKISLNFDNKRNGVAQNTRFSKWVGKD